MIVTTPSGGNIAPGGGEYYSQEDYYRGTDQGQMIEGTWMGRGSASLGLYGGVDKRDFDALVKGETRDGKSLIGDSPKAHRPGLDFTFNAPKSVSIAALAGGNRGLITDFQLAVRDTVEWMESHAAARQTQDGVTKQVQTGNLTVAAYTHTTARPVDGVAAPHLHTHGVFFNVTQLPDGTWRALDNRPLFDLLREKFLGSVAESFFVSRAEAHGHQFDWSSGHAELVDISRDQIEGFSPRHERIEDYMAAHPGATDREAQLATRESKTVMDPEALATAWRELARSLGVEPASQREGTPPSADITDRAASGGLARGIAALEVDRAHFSRDDLTRSSRFALGHEGVTIHSLEQAIDRARASGDLIQLASGRYTTPGALQTDRQIVSHVEAGRGQGPSVSDAIVSRALEGRTFNEGQLAAVKALTQSPDRIQALEGYAGTGKTSVLRAAAAAFREASYDVRGIAPTGMATRTLEEQAGIRSSTVDHFLGSREASASGGNRRVLIVDEAGMLGSQKLRDILDIAARQGTQVILVGDKDQLSPINAGKPFADLTERNLVPRTELTEIVRQRNPDLRDAITRLVHHRDPAAVVEKLTEMGAIREVQDRTDRIEATAQEYLSRPPDERANTLIITATNAERQAINQAIREGLHSQEVLDRSTERTFEVLQPKSLQGPQLLDPTRYAPGDVVTFFRAAPAHQIAREERGIVEGLNQRGNLELRLPAPNGSRLIEWKPDANGHAAFTPQQLAFAVGDQVVALQNDRALNLRNGDLLTITKTGDSTLEGRIGDRTVDLSQYPYLDHGYGLTAHKSQSQTVDHVIASIDTSRPSSSANEGYVDLSRARDSVTILTDSTERLAEVLGRWLQPASVMGTALGEQGRHDGPGPQGQSAPTTGVTQATEQAVASSAPTPFPFTSWPEHTVSPPAFPTPEREREQKPEEKTEKKPEKEQAAKELDQEKEKHPGGSPAKGGANAEDTPQTKDASQPDDRRPLNRAGQMIYGPDRLRATFGPKHWKASAIQPNQTWAKGTYVLQAKSFGEGLRRMTHRVRAVRVQQTWTGRGNAIREAKGAWGTLKAAYAPTAKTIYLVDKPFRGVRHASRIASTPTIGSAARRVFERQERVYDPKAKEFVGQQRQPSVARGPQPPSAFWKALATVSRVGLGYRPPDQPNRFERWLGNITKEAVDGWKKIGITGGRGLAHAATAISRVARQAGSKLKQQAEKLGRGKTGQTSDKDKPAEKTEQEPTQAPTTTPGQSTGPTPSASTPFFSQAGQAITPPVIPTPEREREGNKGKTEPEQDKEKKEPEQDTGKGKTEQDKEKTGRQTDEKGFDFTQWPEHTVTPPVIPTPEREREGNKGKTEPEQDKGKGKTEPEQDKDKKEPGKETTGKQTDEKGFDFKRWPEHTVSPPVIPTPEREREQQTTGLTPATPPGQSTGLATTTGQAADRDKPTPTPDPEKTGKEGPPHAQEPAQSKDASTHDKAGPQSKDAPTHDKAGPQSKEGPPHAQEPAHDKSSGGKSPRDPKGHPEPQKEAPGPGGSKGREAADQGKGKTPGREKPEQDKEALSRQKDRLTFQQGGSSEKSEKGKEDFGRG